jgi:hypothetical protein
MTVFLKYKDFSYGGCIWQKERQSSQMDLRLYEIGDHPQMLGRGVLLVIQSPFQKESEIVIDPWFRSYSSEIIQSAFLDDYY